MVFFFPSFWKVFLTNTSYGCPASKLSQSTLILGKGWNAPFPSPPCSGQVSRAQVSLLPCRRWWLWKSSEKSIQNAFSCHYLLRTVWLSPLHSKTGYWITLLNYRKFKDQRTILNATCIWFPPRQTPIFANLFSWDQVYSVTRLLFPSASARSRSAPVDGC